MSGGERTSIEQMIFKTENSIYEVDFPNRKIRRLYKESDPTPHQEKDREWKEYTDITAVQLNEPVWIIWGANHDRGTLETTITSPVVEIS